MASSWRAWLLVLVAAQVSLHHMAETRRLLLGEDGFARVDGPSTAPVSGITISSWVNITEFPGGVAPMVTIISEDASYQIAFFVRHDGAGVLWGGPAPLHEPQIEKVDRHPRSRYGNGRKRRNANDYSMGLGDVMNIMTRKERSNTWTPMNFVDVSEMGVADLETSGSETQNHYENWYDVGYELQMQESANPEPKIITQPSGKNDFVVINWNGHNAPPLSTNQWDPVNEGPKTPDFPTPQVATKILPPPNEKFVWSQEESNSDGGWTSQVLPINAAAQSSSIIRDFVASTTTEKTTRSRPSRPFIPDLRRPGVRDSSKANRPVDGFRYSQRRTPEPITTTPTPTTAPSITTVRRPAHVTLEKITTDSRVPLWARLKQTSVEEIGTKEETVTTTTAATTTTPPPTTTTTQGPRVRETTKHPVTRLRQTETSRHFIHRITTTAPIVDIRVPSSTTTRRPPITTYRTTKQSSAKSKERKAYNNLSSKGGFNTKSHSQRPSNPLSSHSLDEFKKVLEGKPKIEDTGNKVVVYSMPITDVEAFNKMYEQYQESVARQSPRINLHAVYDLAREGQDHPALNEDETNQNRLEQVPEPLPVLTYKEEPLHYAESEPAPIIIKETELVAPIIETEQVIPMYEDTAFRPSNLDQIGTLEGDYSYYTYPETSQSSKPIKEDQIAQPSKTRYEIKVPVPEESLPLPVLELRPAYESALPVQQDIGGQQASFYQEPSRISHEQLPPEYSEKSEKEAKNRFTAKGPAEISRTRITQDEVPDTYDSFAHAEPILPLPQAKPEPFTSADKLRKTEEFITSDQNVPNVEDVRPTEDTPSPIRINAVPIFTNEDPVEVTDVPLNVNFRKMPYSFDLNTWYHLAFAWSSQDHVLRIYINGQLAGILEGTIPDLQALPTNGMMLLGKTLLPSLTGFDPTSHLTGEMSNFVVWSEALTPQEVDNVFSCGKPPVHPVLLAWNSSPLRVYNDAVVQQAPPICGISS